MDFSELILLGEDKREHGDPKGALTYFLQARQIVGKPPADTIVAICQQGLCYEHLGDFDLAMYHYEEALEMSQFYGDIYSLARANRHLCSVYLAVGDLDRAISYGTRAYEFLRKLDPAPNDAVWILHGLVKTLIKAKYPRGGLRRWLQEEQDTWVYMVKTETNTLRKKVWTLGFFADYMHVYPWASLVLGPLGLGIAVTSGLGLRLKQAKARLLHRRYP